MGSASDRNFAGRHIAIAVGILAFCSLLLLLMGREPICRCGDVKLWHGIAVSSENSQHIFDWYTPSHLIHGFIFYGVLWLLARRTALGLRLVAATAVEALWEIVENTDSIINRYREATIALDYYGDSVLNSASDILVMTAGFLLASRLPVWLTALIAIAFELVTAALIRDNLTLNVIMLLWPIDAIRAWQGGG